MDYKPVLEQINNLELSDSDLDFPSVKNYKPFSRKEYVENDPIAKSLASIFLISTGEYKLLIPVEEQLEAGKEKDFDILHIPTNKIVSVEADRKKPWNISGKWATDYKGKYMVWNTIDVLGRKNKSHADIYIMFNRHWDTLATTRMENVLKSNLKEKDCDCGDGIFTKEEPFFKVPVNNFCFFKATNEDKTKWLKIDSNGSLL